MLGGQKKLRILRGSPQAYSEPLLYLDTDDEITNFTPSSSISSREINALLRNIDSRFLWLELHS